MKILNTVIYLACICLSIISCKKAEEEEKVYDEKPLLWIISQSTNSINYTDTTSYLTLHFEFEDGGKDLGRVQSDLDTSIKLLLYDWSTDTFRMKYNIPFPQIAEKDFKKNGGIRATLTLDLPSYIFTPTGNAVRPSGLDTLKIGIALVDLSSNSSDTTFLSPIYVAP